MSFLLCRILKKSHESIRIIREQEGISGIRGGLGKDHEGEYDQNMYMNMS